MENWPIWIHNLKKKKKKKSCSSDLLLSVLPAGIGHWVVLGLAGFIGRVHHPLASAAALALTETNDHARHFSNLFDIYSQGLGLEPNKDLIRTCKDQYSIFKDCRNS